VIALFGLCVLLHLILHWTWICGFVTGRLSRWTGRRLALNESEKTLYGVSTLIVVLTMLGAFVTAADFALRPPAETPSAAMTAPAGVQPIASVTL